jgi:hypothetical protein
MKKVVGFMKGKKRRYEIYDTDVFVVSYPRSGNIWLRYLITNIMHHDKEIDHDLAIKTVIGFHQKEDLLLEEKPIRFIKTHETYTGSYPKVIYIYRDGRDVAGSYYNFHLRHYGYKKSFDSFLKEMLNGAVGFGSWQDHVSGWLHREHVIPFFPIRYEDLLTNTKSLVKQLAEFINIDIEPDIIKQVIDRSSQRSINMAAHKFTYGKTKQFPELSNKPFKWIRYFNKDLQDYFFEKAGDIMLKLGYERYNFQK